MPKIVRRVCVYSCSMFGPGRLYNSIYAYKPSETHDLFYVFGARISLR